MNSQCLMIAPGRSMAFSSHEFSVFDESWCSVIPDASGLPNRWSYSVACDDISTGSMPTVSFFMEMIVI